MNDAEPPCYVEVTLEELSQQQQANARVLGLILLMLAGYRFPPTLIEEVAGACGVCPIEMDDTPAPRSH